MGLLLDIDPRLEERIRQIASKRGIAPTSYAVAAIEERLSRDSSEASEPELLEQIGSGLTDDVWEQYDRLVGKRRAETLTSEEYRTLLDLTNAIELDHAKRLRAVAKLSELRKIDFDVLMKQLGIGPRKQRNGPHV